MICERFNTGWEVIPGTTEPFTTLYQGLPSGKAVTLPHDAMIEEARDPMCLSGAQSGFYPAKTYTYIKRFHAPKEWAEGRQILEFEGVMAKALVYVNEQLAARHANGYSQFFADLKPFLNYGEENTVKVVAVNSELASRWYPGSGIYRDVNLYTGGSTWIPPEKLRLTTEYIEEDYAMVRVDATLSSTHEKARQVTLRVTFYDGETPQVSADTRVTVSAAGPIEARLRLSVADPHLWSLENPHLYRVTAEILEDQTVVDTTEEEFGIRTLRLDARKGLRINGKTVKLRGGCIHHDNGIIGATTLYDAEAFRMKNLKDAGINAIRSAHHPMGKALLRVCDRLGMLVMDELSDMWTIQKNPNDRAFSFIEDWADEVSRMVSKDYNHPCVVLYSTGNEIPEISNPDGRMLHRRIAARFHALDGSRYTTAGLNGLLAAGPGFASYMAQLGVTVAQAKKDTESAEESASQGAGSENLNAMMAKLRRERMAAFSVSPLLTENIEEASGLLDAAGFNYLTARHELEPLNHPDRVVVGSETYPMEIGALWEIAERNPHVIGDFTWTAYDYLGEAGIGIFHYEAGKKKQGWYPDRAAYCGDINLNGYRRPASYLRETAYGLRKTPFIAVDRPEHYGETYDINDWKYGDALDSWTWPGFEGKPVRVRVITDADEAELLINGTSIGRKPVGTEEKYTAYFELPYEPGALTTVCYKDGTECGRTSLETAGDPVRLSVQVVNAELPADGSGVSFLMAEPVDSLGRVNRAVKKAVTVSVEGAGTLLGFGSADPSCEGSYQDTTWETYDGRVMAAVRSGEEPGEITVRFTAEGLPEETAVITVK